MFDKQDDASPGVLTLLWMSPLTIDVDWEQRKNFHLEQYTLTNNFPTKFC